jgi:hypothetical protein
MTAAHDPWANTRIKVMAPQRKQPKFGDRRYTKRHGPQIRVFEMHRGMYVMRSGRQGYEWATPNEVMENPMWQHTLTPCERRMLTTARRCGIQSALDTEYQAYRDHVAEGDPMEYDDWVAGSDLPEIVLLRQMAAPRTK